MDKKITMTVTVENANDYVVGQITAYLTVLTNNLMTGKTGFSLDRKESINGEAVRVFRGEVTPLERKAIIDTLKFYYPDQVKFN